MARMTRFTALVSVTALAVPLTACGSDSDYCESVQDVQDRYSSLSVVDPTDNDMVNSIADAFADIADAAPDDVEGDWNTAVEALRALASVDDIENPDNDVIQQFAEAETAFDNIRANVRDECDLELD
ncbi:hypothetical protein [Phytoactinopolyspora limicola]|uniref:hypothetical protein n=1 Tax=Phytoactinopolyspora limicola TaxID=2715536 RepID=UPI00140E15A0|nr:hypothetical protein [Phytoactinopolyspora limicola]